MPYDSGLAFCAHPEAHRAAMATSATYLERVAGAPREQMDWNPEFSRRARGVPVYAALRCLGRTGVADLVDRCCDLAARFADRLGAEPGVSVLNDVVLNQVLVRFDDVGDRRGGPPGAGRRHLLAERNVLGGAARHAHLGVQLPDHRGRRRPLGRGHPPGGPVRGYARLRTRPIWPRW